MSYYCAYGSNTNLEQMKERCPKSRVVGTGYIKGWELAFNGVATIVPKSRGRVPVVVWDITPQDEAKLDQYEGYPNLYRKEMVDVALDTGEKQECMVYIMNRTGSLPPTKYYYRCIERGYIDNDIPLPPLESALARSLRR